MRRTGWRSWDRDRREATQTPKPADTSAVPVFQSLAKCPMRGLNQAAAQLMIRGAGAAQDPGLVDGVADRDGVAIGQGMVEGNHEVERIIDEEVLAEPIVPTGGDVGSGHDDADVGIAGEQEIEAFTGLGL